MDQLNGQDAQFLYIESADNLTHITSVSIFDQSTVPGKKVVRFKDILDHISSRLHMNPVFRRRLVHVPLELDFPYWVDDDQFDLEFHVRHGGLPEPGDWRQFCIHMARYHSRGLDMTRPLWEMYVIEGLDNIESLSKGSYAIATKIHHAAADGAALADFFGAMADIDNKGTPAVPLNSAKLTRSPQPSLLDMGVRAAWHTMRSPVGMIDAVMRSAPSLYKLAQHAISTRKEDEYRIPETRFNGAVSASKMFDGVQIPLADLKAIRLAVPGCTINDVILTVCGGALRKYLQHHGELPKDSLLAWVPINARKKAATGGGSGGNYVTAMTTLIYTDIKNPIERLQRVMGATQKSKAAQTGVSARVMTDLSKHVPAATQVLASRLVLRTGAAARMCNLFISNVPGPQLPLYMNGALQVGLFGMAPLSDGMGLFIAATSYNGKVSFSVTSTREVLPDIQFFITCIQKSVAEMKRAAMPKKKRKKKKKKSPAADKKKVSRKQPKLSGDQPDAHDDQNP
jgi:WS/DGAT/MGAT family acyltransferase